MIGIVGRPALLKGSRKITSQESAPQKNDATIVGEIGLWKDLMSTTLRRYAPDQSLLLPPDVRAWLPEGHLAQHVSDLVDGLDLTAFYAPYEGDGRRNAPYEPRNFTDPESGIMKTSSEGFQQCYNAQVAVDGKHQLVVATDLTANASDQGGLPALLDDVAETFGRPTSSRESSTAQTPRSRSGSQITLAHQAAAPTL